MMSIQCTTKARECFQALTCCINTFKYKVKISIALKFKLKPVTRGFVSRTLSDNLLVHLQIELSIGSDFSVFTQSICFTKHAKVCTKNYLKANTTEVFVCG